jgi:class 3 adenylate cyclase/TolB-like protein
MERKLAAILAADVVGYSAHMERDEAGTFERLRAGRRELFEPEIEKRHGRIFKLMGDGLLAEFSSVVDAVECAVSLQRGLAERNAALPEEQRIEVRIGINLGEVIVEDDDRYGEGVNVAARLQQLAEPGGICVSGKVAHEVEKKLAFGFQSLGEQRVKNIAEPVPVYRVLIDGGAAPLQRRKAPASKWRMPAAVAAVVVLALLVAAGAWYKVLGPASTPVTASGLPSLAVLPFVNMSGDPAEDYLGPGVAESIITTLSSFPSIRVISRTSSFIYDKPVKVQQVAEDLGVSYVLEGSVQKSGKGVRITAQLVDARSGDHIWANRYEEEGEDVALLQENVANKIYESVAGLRGEIRKQEEREAWQKSGPSLGEYDYYLRGHQFFFEFTADSNEKARRIWQEGLTKYPDSALIAIKLAWTYVVAISNGWSADPKSDLETAWKLATEAQGKESKSKFETFLCHWLMAQLYQYHDGDFVRSIEEAHIAAEMVPNDPFSRIDNAEMLARAGAVEEAVAWAEDALRHDPKPLDWYFVKLALAYYLAGRPQDAVTVLTEHKVPWATPILAAANVRAGKLADAQALIAAYLKDNSWYSLKYEATYPAGVQPSMVEKYPKPYLDDLRKAGVPEG